MKWKQKDRHGIEVPAGVINVGIYRNLMEQFDRIWRHNRQLSFKTRDRYYEANERFIRFLADEYRLQKIANIEGKHVAAYILYLQEKGVAAGTIKTELAAIRFAHDAIPQTRSRIPSNIELLEQYNISLEKRKFGGVNRRWTDEEYSQMLSYAVELSRVHIARIMVLGRHAGLRIHEAVRIDRATAEAALRSGFLKIKGKGGRVRAILARQEVLLVLQEAMRETGRGQKLFVSVDQKAHEVMESVQQFIARHRNKFARHDRASNLTFHGLRHTFAYEEYIRRKDAGLSEEEARLQVSELLGHSRADVTTIYIYTEENEDMEEEEEE